METTATHPEDVAVAYFEAWRAGDADQVRPLLAEDVDSSELSEPPKASMNALPACVACSP